MLASPWEPEEERVSEETRLLTCILYHLYTAPLKISLLFSSFYFVPTPLLPQRDDDCGKSESRQNVRHQADDLSTCLSVCPSERQAYRTWVWLAEEE